MIVRPGFADKERMARGRLAEILIRRQGVVERPGRELRMNTQFGIDVRVQIQAQTITHARVLLMRKRRETRGRIRLGRTKDAVKAQTEVAAESNRANAQHLIFQLLNSIVRGWRILRRRRGGGGSRSWNVRLR